ncbi:MAG: NAD(P)-binding domain-containing protein [Steroidobacteraceae bacterium]
MPRSPRSESRRSGERRAAEVRASNYQHKRSSTMSYAIIGFGAVGQALARAFSRKNIEVSVASRRPPEALAPQARAIGPQVVAKPLQEAIKADIIFLAVPFWEHQAVAKALGNWKGKTIVDTTNAFRVAVADLDGLPSSVVVARAFAGAKFVKGFNHLPAAILGADPQVEGGRRVVFLSSDNEGDAAPVTALAKQLGFAPIQLGKLDEGGRLVQARGDIWTQLIFQDLFKKEE